MKNPKCPDANQLAIYKDDQELDQGLPRTTPARGQSGI